MVSERIAESVLDAIGRTPAVRLRRLVEPGSADVLVKLTDELRRRTEKLARALEHDGEGAAEKHAKHFRDAVVPAMEALRETGDQLELMIPHGTWPLATYREMLFIK